MKRPSFLRSLAAARFAHPPHSREGWRAWRRGVHLAGLVLAVATLTAGTPRPRKVFRIEGPAACSGPLAKPHVLVVPGVLSPPGPDRAALEHATASPGRGSEAWFRLGELDFASAEPGALARARAEYAVAASVEHSPNRLLAMYRLAWTHHRLDEPVLAADGFAALLDALPPQAPLREESLHFLGVLLADCERYDDAQRVRFFEQRGQPSWTREAWRHTARQVLATGQYDDAVAAWRRALAPLDVAAPALHVELLRALEAKRDVKAVALERKAIAAAYGPGSAWHEQHRADVAALAAAQAQVRASQAPPRQEPPRCGRGIDEVLLRTALPCASGATGLQRVGVQLLVGEDQRVREVRVDGGGALRECVREAARGWLVPGADGEACTTEVSVLFAVPTGPLVR